MPSPTTVRDLRVYQLLCEIHIAVCDLTLQWPSHERFELGSQVRRSSNSAPANLAEKHGDKHLKNWLEGINRARGETLETIHHLYIALRKNYISPDDFSRFETDLNHALKMLVALQKSAEKRLPPDQRQFPTASDS